MNETYLSPEIVNQIRLKFNSERIIVLDDFLSSEDYRKLKKLLNKNGKKEFRADKYSYTKLDYNLKMEKYLFDLLGVKVKQANVIRFGHKDFTLLHDDYKSKQKLEIGFIIGDNWKPEFGGNIVYTDGENPVIIPVRGNRLFVIDKKANLQDFVKYVNSLAGKNKFVLVKFEI